MASCFSVLISPSLNLLRIMFLIVLLLLRTNNPLCAPKRFFLSQDIVSTSIVILRMLIFTLIIMAQFSSHLKSYLTKIWIFLMLSLVFVFSSSDIVFMYFFFEISLIPIFIIVIGWGYQPERLLASLFLFFYTLFASLPLIVFILYVTLRSGSNLFLIFLQYSVKVDGILTVLAILAFIVKFPVFTLHLWLPKAHVEAPVSGSIILAGVLLKLGGYGLLRMRMLLSSSDTFNFISIIILGGGRILRVLCIGTSDIKIIIAYSSVVHIALIVIALKWELFTGLTGGIIIILSHGICSSGLFALANSIYERSHSRSFILNKGSATNNPLIVPIFFILISANFGGPFTLNLLGEVLLIINLRQLNQRLLIRVVFLSFFSAAYSLMLFRRVSQGSIVSPLEKLNTFDSRELICLVRHCWPLIFLCCSPIFI